MVTADQLERIRESASPGATEITAARIVATVGAVVTVVNTFLLWH